MEWQTVVTSGDTELASSWLFGLVT